MALVRGKLAEGVEPARLGAAIAGVTRDRHCDPAIEAHRIILGTPVSQDATRAAFAGGLFTVSGQGVSVRDAAGLPEAWFDPAQPVQLEIRMSDGTSVSASGVLPLGHALVRAQHQYDLTARADRPRDGGSVGRGLCLSLRLGQKVELAAPAFLDRVRDAEAEKPHRLHRRRRPVSSCAAAV